MVINNKSKELYSVSSILQTIFLSFKNCTKIIICFTYQNEEIYDVILNNTKKYPSN